MTAVRKPNGETGRPPPFFVTQWFWVIPRRAVSPSVLLALALAVPVVWLFARWLPWPLTVLFLGGQLAYVHHAIKKTSLLVLADRDLRARETELIKADLRAIYEVLERNRQARQQRLNALIR